MVDIVSIIMPVYNSEKTVKRAIESIINQTYLNWELIIVNDGSTDKTLEICSEYIDNLKIKIIDKKNEGPSSARNLGINKASGKYIMFIDSDDIYESNIIEKMLNHITSDRMVCCNYYKINFEKKQYKKIQQDIVVSNDKLQYFVEETQKNTLFNIIWNKIYLKDIIVENNILFDEQIDFGEDLEFNIEYFKYVKSAYLIKEPLYNYYIENSSSSFKYRENDFFIRLHNVEKLEELYTLKNYCKDFVIEKYLEAFIQSSARYIQKCKNKKICIEKISQYIDAISLKIFRKEVKIYSLEEKIIYNLIKNKKSKQIYIFLKIRNFIKKVKCQLFKKVYR